MSQTDHPSSNPKGNSNQVPDGLAKGILGFVLGAGVSFLGMHFYGPREYIRVPQPTQEPPGEGELLTMPGSTPGGNAAAPPPGGGMAGGAGKRNLTSLVGKLELLSRNDLRLHVEFEQEQAAKIAFELAELEAAKTLTADEAQSRLEALESLLTPEQKKIVDSIGLPFNRPAGGGGPGGGMQAPASDENPFAEETNEKPLKELLERLKPVAGGNATSGN